MWSDVQQAVRATHKRTCTHCAGSLHCRRSSRKVVIPDMLKPYTKRRLDIPSSCEVYDGDDLELRNVVECNISLTSHCLSHGRPRLQQQFAARKAAWAMQLPWDGCETEPFEGRGSSDHRRHASPRKGAPPGGAFSLGCPESGYNVLHRSPVFVT